MKKLFALLTLLPSLCFGQRTVLYNESDFTLYAPSSFWTANSTSISNALSLSVFLTQPEGDALYQPNDATLTALAGALTGSDTLIYFSAADTAAVTTFTAWGRGLVDDADQTAARVTLGLVPGTDVQAYDSDLAAVAGLASNGLLARTSSGNFSTRTITGDSEITVSNGDGVSGNPTLAIAASITRDSELSSYAPLAGPTFTGDPKAPTPAASDNDTSIATTAFVQTEIASLGSGSDQWSEWDDWEVRRWEFTGSSSATALEPGLAFTAIASGTGGQTTGLAVFDGQQGYYIRTASGAATSTGGYIADVANALYFTDRARQFKTEFSLNRTNGAIYRIGYGDSSTTSEPTDGLQLVVTNDVICGVALANSVKAVTASTFQLQQGVSYTLRINQTNTYGHLLVYSNVFGGSPVLIWEDTIAAGLPSGSSRLLGVSVGGFNTSTTVTNAVEFLHINRMIERKAR